MKKLKAEDTAPAKYKESYVCSEAILLSLREEGTVNFSDDVIRASTGFGAGVGWSKHLCGALSGGVMAIGVKYGRTGLNKSRKPSWDCCFELVRRFAKKYGTIQCGELIKSFNDLAAKERISHCQKIIRFVTTETKKIIKDSNDKNFATPERDAYYKRREKTAMIAQKS